MENLRAAVAECPGEFPLLEQSLVDARPAYSPKIEWLTDELVDGKVKRAVLHNYLQIFRADSKREILKKIESALGRDTPPTLDYAAPAPYAEMGGIAHFNRELHRGHGNPGQLRVLRDLFYREDIGWFVEVSVQV